MRSGGWWLLAVVGCLAARGSPATTIAAWDLADMAAASAVVLRGQVTGLETHREPSGRIWTQATVDVLEVLRGGAGEAVVVAWPGGKEGTEGQWVSGTPTLSMGQEVVLFLGRSGPEAVVARHLPVGLGAGVLTVQRTASGSRLTRDLRGLFCPDGLPPPALPETLEDLREALRVLEEVR